jgi:hypothetical protein
MRRGLDWTRVSLHPAGRHTPASHGCRSCGRPAGR